MSSPCYYSDTLLHVGMYLTGYITKALHGHLVQHVQHSALSIYLAVQVFKVGPPEMFSSPNNRKQSRMNENACHVHNQFIPSLSPLFRARLPDSLNNVYIVYTAFAIYFHPMPVDALSSPPALLH